MLFRRLAPSSVVRGLVCRGPSPLLSSTPQFLHQTVQWRRFASASDEADEAEKSEDENNGDMMENPFGSGVPVESSGEELPSDLDDSSEAQTAEETDESDREHLAATDADDVAGAGEDLTSSSSDSAQEDMETPNGADSFFAVDKDSGEEPLEQDTADRGVIYGHPDDGGGFEYRDGDPRKKTYEKEREYTAELRKREINERLTSAFAHLPAVPEPIRDILMSYPKLKILETIWDKCDLPADAKETDLLDLSRALRTADYEFFNESFPEDVMETDAFTEQSTRASRIYEEERRRVQDDEEKFINSLTDLVLVDIGSHARITKDGIVNSTSVLMIGGNQRGYGGFGRGKGADFETAFHRAKRSLRKNMLYVPRAENRSLFQSVVGKHNNTQVMMKACRRGMGRTAGPLVGHILQAFGIEDVSTRVYGGTNPYSTVYAVFNGLGKQISAQQMAQERGLNYYIQFEPGVRAPKAMTYTEWKDQIKLAHQLLQQSAAEITRRYSNQEKEKIRAPRDQMGAANNWEPNRAPPERFSDVTYEQEVSTVHVSQFGKELDPLGRTGLPQIGTPRSVPKPLPRREVY